MSAFYPCATMKVPSTFHIFYFSLLISVFISFNANGQNNTKVDSIIGKENAPLDTLINWLENNVDIDHETFRPVADLVLQEAYLTKNPKTIASAHQQIANWHGFNGFFSLDSSLYHSKKVVSYTRLGGDSIEVANALKDLSLEYMNNAQNDKALIVIFQALEIFEEADDQAGIAGIYKNLSSMYAFSGEGEKAVEYANKALSILENTDDYYTIAIANLNLIKGYSQLEQYDKALKAAETCIDIGMNELPDQYGILLRGHSWRYDVYLKMEKYDLAYKDAVKAWTIAKEAAGEERAASFRLEIGNTLFLQGKAEEALPHFEAAIAVLEMQELKSVSVPFDLISKCYEDLGQYNKALRYRKKAAEIDKNNLQTQVENLNSESVIKYETDKKNEELIMQQAMLKQKTKVQILMASIAGILALSLVLLFSSYRKNKETSRKLEVKNQENELLLKEIHHRVKNNLQTISSLLNLQSESIKDEAAYDAVQESKNRVASMALIHQKLYQGENLAAIEMKDYFETISKAVKDSFGEKADNIDLEIDMNEIELDVDTAVPIGLITNELLTNSFKYAFPEHQSGSVKISMTKTSDNLIQLEISDDGVGMKKDHKGQGFGTLLIQLLTTQLGGTLERKQFNGTSVILQFKEQEKSVA